MSEQTYDSTIRRLDDLYHRPIRAYGDVGLKRITYLLQRLGNPERGFRTVHVAGSSGKGSTTTMIAQIMQSAGFRTGCFRSPHLQSYSERIAVDDVSVGRADWVELFEGIWPIVEEMSNEQAAGYDRGRPSWFEVMFALACMYFRRRHVEWAAIETGMGGRLDATNVLHPDVAVVTTISLEHTQVLGDTVEKIAAEKAAIIKPGATAVSGVRDPGAREVIRRRTAMVGAPLREAPGDVSGHIAAMSLDGTAVDFRGPGVDLHACLRLAGRFQVDNASVAVAVALALRERGVPIDDRAIRDGLHSANLPGRFEVIDRTPLVIIDGAHHPGAMSQMRQSLDDLLPATPLTFLVAILQDKDGAAMASTLAGRAERIVVTRAPGTERAANPVSVGKTFTCVNREVTIIDDPGEAFLVALRQTPSEGALVVCGSLYLVGFVRSLVAAQKATK